MHAGLFVCFLNLLNSDLEYRIFNMLAYTYGGGGGRGGTSVYSLIARTFVESALNLTPEKSQGKA